MDRRHQNVLPIKSSEEPAPPGIPEAEYKLSESPKKSADPAKPLVSSKGIENAKKRLRAFSIQKRTPLHSAPPPKPSGSGTTPVFIGRVNSIKPSRFAPIEDDTKKPPRPPKLGSARKILQDSYTQIQKKTLSEIEDMKRKMELVDLGIPLGLICPGIVDDRAMPTKAMPPIKTLLDPAKVDQITREAKKAQQEGREYKFDYRKLLPDYDNPFQRKKEDSDDKFEKPEQKVYEKDNKRRDSYKHESNKYPSHNDRHVRIKSKETHGASSKSRERDHKSKDPTVEIDKNVIEANLKDYLVCDSWSLDEKTNSSSPKVVDKSLKTDAAVKRQKGVDDHHKVKGSPLRAIAKDAALSTKSKDSPIRPKDSPLLTKAKGSPLLANPFLTKGKDSPVLVQNKVKLQPVIDSFKYEIDEPIDDDVIELYDVEDIPLPPAAKKNENPVTLTILDELEDTPSCDGMDDDTFMESVINEMKDDNIDDDFIHEKSLVEYDLSPVKDDDSKDFPDTSVTPELDDSMRELQSSRHSNYSDGYRSTESGYKSTESGYKSTESGYKSIESGYRTGGKGSNETKAESKRDKSKEKRSKSPESDYRSSIMSIQTKAESKRDKSKEKRLQSPGSDYRSSMMSIETKVESKRDKPKEKRLKSPESDYRSSMMSIETKAESKRDKSKEKRLQSPERDYRSSMMSIETKAESKKDKPKEKRLKSPESDYRSSMMSIETKAESKRDKYKEKRLQSPESDYRSSMMSIETKAGSKRDKSKEKRLQSPESDYRSSMMSIETKGESKRDKSKEKRLKSPESDYRSSLVSIENEDETSSMRMSKYTLESLETWSFVLKFCQPLLFRHDKSKCYKETLTAPKLWFAEAPKHCACVNDREVIYAELKECKMALVDRVYGCDQIPDAPSPTTRPWFPRINLCLVESTTVPIASDWEEECPEVKGQVKGHKFEVEPVKDKVKVRRSMTPLLNDEISVDREYQKFMEAVWPSVVDSKTPTPRCTPPAPTDPGGAKIVGANLASASKGSPNVEGASKGGATKSSASKGDFNNSELTIKGSPNLGGASKAVATDVATDVRKSKRLKLSSDGWSQESEVDEEPATKKIKTEKKEKSRKRKHSALSVSDSDSEDTPKKKKKDDKKKGKKKMKSKLAKRRRTVKKRLKKLKEKQKKKKAPESDEVEEKEIKKGHKKSKKKKQLKLKKKDQKKKNLKKVSSSSDKSSSSSSTTESSSETESSSDTRKSKKQQKRRKKDKKRKKSTSESTQSETDLFDANVLNNIKKELTDDERNAKKIPREIINVKELQNDFVGNNLLVKQEELETSEVETDEAETNEVETNKIETNEVETEVIEPIEDTQAEHIIPDINDIPLPQKIPVLDENLSQSSSQASQESVCSVHEFEKDESHLRPSSQNSNYSFNDVIASRSGLYNKAIESVVDCEKFGDNYEPENYEVYEQMALEYQNDVANQQSSGSSPSGEQKIETVVRRRGGEIKCDWRAPDKGASDAGGAGDRGASDGGAAVRAATTIEAPLAEPRRPSRWGLKPGEVNIVLTGGSEQTFTETKPSTEPVYQIESLANRNIDNNSMSYDEAYMHTYGASDRLQYGDCFAEEPMTSSSEPVLARYSLDDRIDKALRNTVLGEVARDPDDDKENKDKNKSSKQSRCKSVSFADGYKPGQDSDVEEPPKKKKRGNKRGCAWPCPASHPDHVPLWDALPPPPPPAEPCPGPPPPQLRVPPLSLLDPRIPPPHLNQLKQMLPPHHGPIKYEPTPMGFMPPEPPPGLITFN